MATTSENNKRIAKNTMLMYIRMMLMMGISLYTSRVVLQTLGVSDYGIYNVVGGFVSMFSMISGTLSSAISRYLTFELGKGNKPRLSTIFSTAINIQLLLSVIVIIVVELFGVWYLNTKMVLPAERLLSANVVLQMSLISFVLSLLSVPYNAAIIAHEKISIFAYVSIMESFLKLSICFIIMFAPIDKLVLYSILMMLVSLTVRVIYGIYCSRNFEECIYKKTFDKNLLKEMFAFSGWNFIGASSGIMRDQGVNLLLNLFWGTTVNAARGIATQVSYVLYSFSDNFLTAVKPQITKTYAQGDYNYTFRLVLMGSKMSYFLMYLVALPMLLEANNVLTIWLGEIPDYTVAFVRLIITLVMLEAISSPLVTLMLATGNIRNYQIVVGGCQLLNFPLSYILLYNGFQPEYTTVVAIFVGFLCLFLRVLMLKSMVLFPAKKYVTDVIMPIILVSFITIVIFYLCLPHITINNTFAHIVVVTLLSLTMSIICIYFLGCNTSERSYIRKMIAKISRKWLLQ